MSPGKTFTTYTQLNMLQEDPSLVTGNLGAISEHLTSAKEAEDRCELPHRKPRKRDIWVHVQDAWGFIRRDGNGGYVIARPVSSNSDMAAKGFFASSRPSMPYISALRGFDLHVQRKS